jgi:hypothetical protein
MKRLLSVRIASGVARFQTRRGFDRLFLFGVHGPIAQTEQVIEEGIHDGRDQDPGHHGWGDGDPGGKDAPKDRGGQRQAPGAGFHESNPRERGPCGLSGCILTALADAGKGAVQKCVRVGLRKIDRLVRRYRNEPSPRLKPICRRRNDHEARRRKRHREQIRSGRTGARSGHQPADHCRPGRLAQK